MEGDSVVRHGSEHTFKSEKQSSHNNVTNNTSDTTNTTNTNKQVSH